MEAIVAMSGLRAKRVVAIAGVLLVAVVVVIFAMSSSGDVDAGYPDFSEVTSVEALYPSKNKSAIIDEQDKEYFLDLACNLKPVGDGIPANQEVLVGGWPEEMFLVTTQSGDEMSLHIGSGQGYGYLTVDGARRWKCDEKVSYELGHWFFELLDTYLGERPYPAELEG